MTTVRPTGRTKIDGRRRRIGLASARTRRWDGPLAVVIGDMDLVRPLALAGIRSAVMARPGDLSPYSRFTAAALDWIDPWKEPEALVENVVDFAKVRGDRPVLFYDGDGVLLAVSRHRDRFREALRFVIADATLVEDLVDKARFLALAERLALPVPRALVLAPARTPVPTDADLRFPVVVKPRSRPMVKWQEIGRGAKAVGVSTRRALGELWPRVAELGIEVVVQELIPGPETEVESYHAYIDEVGTIVAEFTGRKIRTSPPESGYSTSVVITEAPDVAELGRDILKRLDLRGVAKCDFKRDPDGALYLLEINPRFTLWHHPAARAGVNIPALVYGDLTGAARGPAPTARAGVRWCSPSDARAAKAAGIPLLRWLAWALTCEAKWGVAWNDPEPLLRVVLRRLSRLSRRVTGSDRSA